MDEPNSDTATSVSLLLRVREGDVDAWNKLEYLYKPTAYAWCRSRGVPQADVLDVVQEVLIGVTRNIGSFNRERHGDFRRWLWTITRNKMVDFRRKRQCTFESPGGDNQDWLRQIPEEAPPESDDNMDSPTMLLRRAMEAIQTDFPPRDWEAFYRMVVDGDTAKEIAADQNRTEKSVRQAKYRVLKRLRQDYEDLGDFLP